LAPPWSSSLLLAWPWGPKVERQAMGPRWLPPFLGMRDPNMSMESSYSRYPASKTHISGKGGLGHQVTPLCPFWGPTTDLQQVLAGCAPLHLDLGSPNLAFDSRDSWYLRRYPAMSGPAPLGPNSKILGKIRGGRQGVGSKAPHSADCTLTSLGSWPEVTARGALPRGLWPPPTPLPPPDT